MGRLNEAMIQHFSHPHPLYLSSLNQQQLPLVVPLTCANCTLPANTGLTYTCKPCNFNLHLNCAQMPPLIQHPYHPAHQLTLLPLPAANPKGRSFFDCNACGGHGTGFSYHCPTCYVHLHARCASMPLTVNSSLHGHPLALAFSPPYDNKRFSCDACGGPGGDHWLYRCAPCGFDTHVGCLGGQQASPRGAEAGQVSAVSCRSVGVGTEGLSRSGSGRGGGLVRQMVQGLVGVASQQIGHKFLPGYTGGRGGGGRGENANAVGGRGGPVGWNGNVGGRGNGGSPNAWNGNVSGRGNGGSPNAWNGNGNGNGSFGGRNDQNVYGAGASNDQVGASGDDYADWNGYVDTGDGSTSYSGNVLGGDGSVTWNAYG